MNLDGPKHGATPFIVLGLVATGITIAVVGAALVIYFMKKRQYQAYTEVNVEEDKK